MLIWLKESVDRELQELKKRFGITDEEILDRLNELKENFITMRFYKKKWVHNLALFPTQKVSRAWKIFKCISCKKLRDVAVWGALP